MVDTDRNAQAKFLDALKDKSLQKAVDILEGIHDGKEALNHAARAAEASGSPVAPLIPRLGDVRRVSELLFDVARLQVDALDRLFGLRSKHTRHLEERIGEAMGFPLRGNRSEVLDLVIPVQAVEADRKERPSDGESTRYCEIHRQFRVRNLTKSEWPAGAAATPVRLSWSREPKIDRDALRVEVLRDPAATAKEAVLPLRVRIRWSPGALDAMDPAAVASGRYELEGPDGRLAKAIELALRFDPSKG